MKYDSLNHRDVRRLEKIYDTRHAEDMPQEPAVVKPEMQRRETIDLGGGTDLYFRVNTSENYNGMNEARVYIRVVGSSEHFEIGVPIEALKQILNEGTTVFSDAERWNTAAQQHNAALKAHNEAKEQYQEKRERDLREALASGKYTEADIKGNPDDIAF